MVAGRPKKIRPVVSGTDPAAMIMGAGTTQSGTVNIGEIIINTPPNQEEVKEKRRYPMKTKKITAEKLFLFVSQDTLPPTEINRFLRLCESMILSLGEDSLSDNDVEEIALIYRDRIYTDRQYSIFAKAEALDTSMVSQIEKLNKALEQRKANLGARFIDKGKTRKDANLGDSFVSLFNYFTENKDLQTAKGLEKQKQIEDNKAKFTSTADYMKNQSTQSQIDKVLKDDKEN